MVTRAIVPVKQQLPGTGAQENSTPYTLTVSPEDKVLDETGLPTDPCVTDVKCFSRVRTAAVSAGTTRTYRGCSSCSGDRENGTIEPWGADTEPMRTAESTRRKLHAGRVALTSLALVKATPEKAYLSTTRVTPWLNFSFINGL